MKNYFKDAVHKFALTEKRLIPCVRAVVHLCLSDTEGRRVFYSLTQVILGTNMFQTSLTSQLRCVSALMCSNFHLFAVMLECDGSEDYDDDDEDLRIYR